MTKLYRKNIIKNDKGQMHCTDGPECLRMGKKIWALLDYEIYKDEFNSWLRRIKIVNLLVCLDIEINKEHGNDRRRKRKYF